MNYGDIDDMSLLFYESDDEMMRRRIVLRTAFIAFVHEKMKSSSPNLFASILPLYRELANMLEEMKLLILIE